ncbi:MAG: NUDIX hydrolase [Chloroflexota bacterium]
MAEIAFCARCGGKLAESWVAGEGRKRLVCEACGYIHYLNPKVVAATLPVVDGKVALVRRAIEPGLGAWSYPAGYVELGETVEEAARRETWEETYMEVRLGRLLNVYSRSQAGVVVVAYLAEWVGGEMKPGSETLEVALFAPDEIPWERLAFPTVVAALRDWVELSS